MYNDNLYISCHESDICMYIITQLWSKISKAIDQSVEWPEARYGHAATCISDSLLVVVGGLRCRMSCNSWICDLTTMLWKKVQQCYAVYMW